MRPSDLLAFRNAISAVCLTFGREATDPLFDAYWMGLSDLSIESLQLACAEAIRTCTFFPKPVELRRLAGEQTGEQRAIAAWGEALNAGSLGAWRHVSFDDKLINATIRNLGGWPAFVDRLDGDKQQDFARVNFLKTYQAFAAGGVDGEACKPLPGLSEATSVGGVQQAPIVHRIACSPDRAKLQQPAIENVPRAVPNLVFKKVD